MNPVTMAAPTHGANEETGDEHQERHHVAQRAEAPARRGGLDGKIDFPLEHETTKKDSADYCNSKAVEVPEQGRQQGEGQGMGHQRADKAEGLTDLMVRAQRNSWRNSSRIFLFGQAWPRISEGMATLAPARRTASPMALSSAS